MWVTVDNRHYLLHPTVLGRIEETVRRTDGSGGADPAVAEQRWRAAAEAWVRESIGSRSADAVPPDSDLRRVEFVGAKAREFAGPILDGWCRLTDGRAYDITYRFPGAIYVITPQLRMNLPSGDIDRILVEAGSESPTVLIDTRAAVIMLGLDTVELSLLPEDPPGPDR